MVVKRSIILFFIISFFWSSIVIAKTSWVENSASLIKELNSAVAGDKIILLPGQYKLDRFESKTGGTVNAPILVSASALDTVVIHASRVETFSIYHPYWIFENLVIKGTDKTHHALHLSGDADHIIIRNNKFINFHSHIKSNGRRGQFPDDVLIVNNYFSNDTLRATSEPTSPIDVVGGHDWIVRSNVVKDFGRLSKKSVSYGIFLKGHSVNGLIEQNLVICSQQHNSGYRVGLSLGGGGTGKAYCEQKNCDYEHRRGTIKNNVVMNCSDAGIYLKKAFDSKVYHNTLINTLGIDAQLMPTSAVIENNYVGGVIQARKGAVIESNFNMTTAWGWLPYAEKMAQYGIHRISDYPAKYPSVFKVGQIERLQGWLKWFGRWVADSRMGLGRDKAANDFKYFGYGDLTPITEGLLITTHRLNSVKKDFWGNLRETDKTYIGAIDLSNSSCDVARKLMDRLSVPKKLCLDNIW